MYMREMCQSEMNARWKTLNVSLRGACLSELGKACANNSVMLCVAKMITMLITEHEGLVRHMIEHDVYLFCVTHLFALICFLFAGGD
jgi:hypothetical protein